MRAAVCHEAADQSRAELLCGKRQPAWSGQRRSVERPEQMRLCDLAFAEAGLPDGVFNVIHGDRVAVERLIAHPDIAALSFVGSTPIARHIYTAGTAAGK